MDRLSETPVLKKRPDRLMILCVLSGINSLFHIMSESIGLMTINNPDEITSSLNNELDNIADKGIKFFDIFKMIFTSLTDVVEHMRILSIVELVSAVVVLISVILMWRLRKIGFYLYTLVQIILLIAPVAIVGMNLIVGIEVVFSFIISSIFIALYATTLKRMNN